MFKILVLLLIMFYMISFVEPVHAQADSLAKSLAPKVPSSTEIKGLWKQNFGKGIAFNRAALEFSSIYNQSLWSDNFLVSNTLTQYNLKASAGIEFAGIPIKAEYVRRESKPMYTEIVPRNWYHASLDAEQYKLKLKKMAEALGPQVLTKSGAQLEQLKTDTRNKLQAEATAKVIKNKVLFDSLSQNVNIADIQSKSPEELEKLFFGNNIGRALDESKNKLETLEKAELEKEKKDSQVLALKEKIAELEDKAAFAKKMASVVSLQKAGGVFDQMTELEKKSAGEYQTLLDDPQALAESLAEKYHLGGIAKVLMMLSQFKLGGQSLPTNNTTIPFLANGISFEINTGDKLLAFSAGKLLPVVSTLSFPTNSSQQSGATIDRSSYVMIHYRKGKMDSDHKGIRLTSFKNRGGNDSQLQPASLTSRNTVLVDLYSRERIAGNNWLTFGISKSLVTGGNPKQGLLKLNNALLKLGAEGKIEKQGMTYQSYFNKTLGSYVNPGENYLGTEGYEAGLYMRVKAQKSKLTTTFRGNTRKFKVPGPSGSTWNNTNYRTSFLYKLKKGQFVQMQLLLHDGYKRYMLNNITSIVRQQSKSLTSDLNLVNRRLFGLYNTSYISVGIQKDVFPVMQNTSHSDARSTALNLIFNQSFLMGEKLLQFNFYYTKVSQGYDDLLYNTKFDMDGGSSFKFNEKLSGGISIVYGYLKGAYSNCGIRSYVSATLGKSIVVDINGDIRRNIKVENPLFERFVNVYSTIKYSLK